MKFFKTDSVTAIFILVISIVVPPLFIVNLILFIVQYSKNKKKQKKDIAFEQEMMFAEELKNARVQR